MCKESVLGWNHQPPSTNAAQGCKTHQVQGSGKAQPGTRQATQPAAMAAGQWQHRDPSVPLLLFPGWCVQNKQKAHGRRSKGLTKVFCFHQQETLPAWISSLSLDKLLGSPILWHAQIWGLPLLSSATRTKCRSDSAQLLATKTQHWKHHWQLNCSLHSQVCKHKQHWGQWDFFAKTALNWSRESLFNPVSSYQGLLLGFVIYPAHPKHQHHLHQQRNMCQSLGNSTKQG